MDRDLQSIQEVRDLVRKAKAAQAVYAGFSQEKVDALCVAVAQTCADHGAELAALAVEETGFGVAADKVLKNQLGSTRTWEYIRDMKTVGVIAENRELGITEVGVPVGVVAALIPSTNPTSTVMYKALICLKSGNAVVFSPHPNASRCILRTVELITAAARRAGAPEGLIGSIATITPEAVDALLKHGDVGVILATGGEAMVRAAYSSGNPALGVGPGNGPAYIEKSADVAAAVRRIIASKTFDNGTICASEQSIVTERCIESLVVRELQQQGAYLLDAEQSRQVAAVLLRANGSMNPAIVGKSAETIAQMAGISVPAGVKVLFSYQTEVSKKNPYSREKLCPVLGFYVEDSWQAACERSIQILMNEGAGHTMTIHSQDESIIREFALRKPVSRLLVNTSAALGGVGATTGLPPALTLGCGSVGKSATSDNVTPLNLINIRRVARGLREVDELRQAAPTPSIPAQAAAPPPVSAAIPADIQLTAEDVAAITREVIKRLAVR